MAKKPKLQPGETPIEAIKHKDRRTNIPTAELQSFLKDDEAAPKTMLYPRDTSLDPQLVWKGKDEQDRNPLEVPIVPIYIQEKVAPKAIIEDFRMEKQGGAEAQAKLFADFNGIQFEELIDFYQHSQHWTNRMILGDSLLVMNSLAEKEGMKGKVQMVFMDPPYGIKFGSNWQVSTRKRDVKDGKVEDASREPEVVKAFRDTWELGINSYLSYLRDRLTVSLDLLTESGSIFVQIGDENVHLVRNVLDEVFGSENFVSCISFAKTTGFSGNYLSSVCDYVLWYAKSIDQLKYRQLYRQKQAGDEGATAYKSIQSFPVDKIWGDAVHLATSADLTSQGASSSDAEKQKVEFNGRVFVPPTGLHWKTTVEGMKKLIKAGRVFLVGNTLRYLRLLEDFPVFPISNIWTDTGIAGFTADKVYVVQTTTEVIQRCILMATDPGDNVLDPTCGSGTTAYVAEQWGRRWITIDTSRVSLALARTRLMSAKYPYYLLADTPDGQKKEMELTGKTEGLSPLTDGDVRKGFVYKRVPHITLKSIANNPDIREGMSREEIEEAVARHAEQELLYDQPYEDKKRIRVAGPFTVESLSPHRVLSMAEDESRSEEIADEQAASKDFAGIIIENLKKAGVQNMRKGEKLVFESLEPFSGRWIQAVGEYKENDEIKQAAICIGPEHGTVGGELVKEAAKEAMQGVGFDLLVVCGFAFDPHVSEGIKHFGKLTVLIAKMNPDLGMDDSLLKKTGTGNLFTVFGEPDITLERDGDSMTVEIRGVDVYDPTTGQIRSNSTDDIACWFIDTNYNEESFFVRHAYFAGADKPYEKLKKALRAEIDPDEWEALYSTKSRPFPLPKAKDGSPGKIAVKVINHYGDEVMRIYDVG